MISRVVFLDFAYALLFPDGESRVKQAGDEEENQEGSYSQRRRRRFPYAVPGRSFVISHGKCSGSAVYKWVAALFSPAMHVKMNEKKKQKVG